MNSSFSQILNPYITSPSIFLSPLKTDIGVAIPQLGHSNLPFTTVPFFASFISSFETPDLISIS